MANNQQEVSITAYLISIGLVVSLFLGINSYFNFFQLDGFVLWKNSDKAAESAYQELIKETPILISQGISQEQIFLRLNSKLENLNDVKEAEKFKKSLIGKVVEWTLRVDSVDKFGSRYYVISDNESPVASEAEDLGKSFAKKLIGSNKQGNAISMCGATYVYANTEESKSLLNGLKEGQTIRVIGVVSDYSMFADKFGIFTGLTKLGFLFQSKKDLVETANCVQISKAILSPEQSHKEYSKMSDSTKKVINTVKEVVNKAEEIVDQEYTEDGVPMSKN